MNITHRLISAEEQMKVIAWHESIGINKDFASRAMKISKELPNVDTLRHLGTKALYLISTLPEEERKKKN